MVKRTSDKEYLATLDVGARSNFRSSGQDTLLVIAIEVASTYCPAWRIASARGARSVMLQELPNPPGASDKVQRFRYQLPPTDAVNTGKALRKDSQRRLLIDFDDEDWKGVQKDLCEDPDKLNRNRQ